jgi:hypothetical protein
MDTTPPRSAGEGPTPEALGDLAKLPAQVVAGEHLGQWADSGLPDSLAALDTPLERSRPQSSWPCPVPTCTPSPARSDSPTTRPATSSLPLPSSSSPVQSPPTMPPLRRCWNTLAQGPFWRSTITTQRRADHRPTPGQRCHHGYRAKKLVPGRAHVHTVLTVHVAEHTIMTTSVTRTTDLPRRTPPAPSATGRSPYLGSPTSIITWVLTVSDRWDHTRPRSPGVTAPRLPSARTDVRPPTTLAGGGRPGVPPR